MQVRDVIREAVAFALLAVVGVCVLSLFSFSSADPSFNNQTSAEAGNMAGIVGAYVADFFYQLFGFAAWLIVALIVVLVVRLALNKMPYAGHLTSLFWVPFVLGVSAFFAAHHATVSGWFSVLPAGSGGALGVMLADALDRALNPLGRDVVLATLLLSSFVAASHLSLLELLRRISRLTGIVMAWFGAGVVTMRTKMESRKDRMQGREVRKREKMERVEKLPPHSEPTIAPQAEVVVSRRARVEKQAELGFKEPSGADFRLPTLALFDKKPVRTKAHNPEALQAMARMLESKLLDYRVEGKVVAVQPGPVVVQFELEPAPGTKANRIIALQDDLARSMAVVSVRVAGNIPGKNVIGIEIPNEEREMVVMHEVLASSEFSDKKRKLPLALGVDIAGHAVVADLVKMPHLLVAGTTGSGKSVSINTMICSMLMTHTPQDLRLIMVDPKMLELSMYEDIPHLLVPVVTSPHKAAKALAWAVFEMERRYQLMSQAKVRNLEGYNQAAKGGKIKDDPNAEPLPLIVIVIDELADLMMVAGKEVEQSICRLAQKARAAGLHLILATQRPSVDVITGLIKANLPTRISFQVSSKIDSRTILDQMGAEQLLGSGDSLMLSSGRELRRVHGAFISDAEVMGLVDFLRMQGEPDYREEVFEVPDADAQQGGPGGGDDSDDKYDEAVDLVIEKGQCSVSMVQRYLRIGYNRASRLVERMEREGLVTPPGSGGMRKVLARSQESGGGVIE